MNEGNLEFKRDHGVQVGTEKIENGEENNDDDKVFDEMEHD